MKLNPILSGCIIAIAIAISGSLLYLSPSFNEGDGSQLAASLRSKQNRYSTADPSSPYTTKTLTTAAARTSYSTVKVASVGGNTIAGYDRLAVKPGYSIIANSLLRSSMTVVDLFGDQNSPVPPPDYLSVFKRNSAGTGYDSSSLDPDIPGWSAPSLSLAPSEAAFVFNPTTGTSTFILIGEVPASASETISDAGGYSLGYSLRSAPLPKEGLIQTSLGLPIVDADAIFKFVNPGYSSSTYQNGLGWSQGQPSISLGEGFWIHTSGSARTWTQTAQGGDLSVSSYSTPTTSSFTVTFSGATAGNSYDIQSSTDLITWVPVTTMTATASTINYSDVSLVDHKFFRAKNGQASQPTNSAVRSFSPSTYTPGSPVTISINALPDPSTIVYSVEDAAPSGWTVSAISSGGSYDSVNKKVKWGPFFDSTPRILTYAATPPAGTSGAKTFSGLVAFDVFTPTPIGGLSTISQ